MGFYFLLLVYRYHINIHMYIISELGRFISEIILLFFLSKFTIKIKLLSYKIYCNMKFFLSVIFFEYFTSSGKEVDINFPKGLCCCLCNTKLTIIRSYQTNILQHKLKQFTFCDILRVYFIAYA